MGRPLSSKTLERSWQCLRCDAAEIPVGNAIKILEAFLRLFLSTDPIPSSRVHNKAAL